MQRPTDLQLALAIVIKKHKPQDVTMKDYLHDLLQHIKSGRQSEERHRHLDQSAFWQSQYTRSKKVLEQEQNISFALKQQADDLQLQVEALQSQLSGKPAAGLKKRKAVDDAKGHTKRTKASGVMTSTPISFAIDFEAFGSGQPGLKALRNLYELHTMLKGQMFGVEAAKLAFHINDTAQALSTIISTISVQSQSSNNKVKSKDVCINHASTITAVARAMTSLLHAMKRLSSYSKSEQLVGNAVHYSAEVFNSVFTTIEEAATQEAKSYISTELAKSTNKVKMASQDKTTSKFSPLHNLMSLLTNLTLVTISRLDKSLPAHAQLLDGMLYHLLHRLGEIVHLFTFSGPRNDSIEHEIRNLSPLNEEARLDPARRLERKAMAIQAPYMLAILKNAIATVPAALKRDLPGGLSQKYYLTPLALDRLQRTLVDACFGPGGRGAGASEDVLRAPRLVGPELTIPKVVGMGGRREETEAEWFEGELWALLGWEILGREEDL